MLVLLLFVCDFILASSSELQEECPSHEELWSSLKEKLLAESKYTPGPAYWRWNWTSVVGKCASGFTMEKKAFTAFIIDQKHSNSTRRTPCMDLIEPIRVWKFIEFSPKECSQQETDLVSFWDFRECDLEEQTILINHHKPQGKQANKANQDFPRETKRVSPKAATKRSKKRK